MDPSSKLVLSSLACVYCKVMDPAARATSGKRQDGLASRQKIACRVLFLLREVRNPIRGECGETGQDVEYGCSERACWNSTVESRKQSMCPEVYVH